MYNRLLGSTIRESSKSVFLLGPRQVGKSTLILSLKPSLVINLANENEYFSFQASPGELEARLATHKGGSIFIDEIQRVPRLLNTIQAILDARPTLKFYLSGSSARKLRKGRANLIPGRVFTYYLTPLCQAELGTDWDEEQALQFGSLPGVVNLETNKEKKKLLSSYTSTYLKEEIMAESLVRGIDGFVRFLRVAAISSGKYLDFSKLSKQSKVPRQSIVRHFEVLEDTLIAKRVENDPDIDLREFDLVKHPKFFFFDLGVCNALRGGFDLGGDRLGQLWEHLVFNQITNSAAARDKELEMYNFRTRGGFEVDFIARIENDKFAIECKAASHVNDSDANTLSSLLKKIPKLKALIVYRGKVEKKFGKIWALPLQKALETIGL